MANQEQRHWQAGKVYSSSQQVVDSTGGVTFSHTGQRWSALHKDAHDLVGARALCVLPCVAHLHMVGCVADDALACRLSARTMEVLQ